MHKVKTQKFVESFVKNMLIFIFIALSLNLQSCHKVKSWWEMSKVWIEPAEMKCGEGCIPGQLQCCTE